MAKESDLLLAKTTQKMKKNNNQKQVKPVMVDGVMTIGKDNKDLRFMDFQSYDDYDAEEFKGKYRVDSKHDGNIYMREIPKRKRNCPIFKDDNCSLSLGKNGIYYFRFQLPEEMAGELPGRLTRQSAAIAQKFIRKVLVTMED